MTRIQRYDEDGTPILAPDAGELSLLWESLAVIQGQNVDKATANEAQSFSLAEFFKRLFLARAELDICASSLELIDKNDPEAIQFKAKRYEKSEPVTSAGFSKAVMAKKVMIKEVAAKLRSKAIELQDSTKVEHDIVAATLLRIRQEFCWNLIRITSYRQITIYFDPSELTPIAAINFSPMLLFRNSSERYLSGDRLNPLHIAIIFRDNSGGLILKLQDSDGIFSKNLKISTQNGDFVVTCKVPELASYDADSWDSILRQARYAVMVRMLVALIEKEAAVNDVILKDSTGIRILGKQMHFSWIEDESLGCPEYPQFKDWYSSFLSSSGQSVSFILQERI